MTETSEKISDFFCNMDKLFRRKSHCRRKHTFQSKKKKKKKIVEFSDKGPNFCIKVKVFIRKHTLQSKNG